MPVTLRSEDQKDDAPAEAQAKDGESTESPTSAQQIETAIAQVQTATAAQINALRAENSRTTSDLAAIRTRHTTDMETLRADLPPICGGSNHESTTATTEARVERVLNKNKFSKNYTFESTDDCFGPSIGCTEANKRALLNFHRDKR